MQAQAADLQRILGSLPPEQQAAVLQQIARAQNAQKAERKVKLRSVLDTSIANFKTYAMNTAFWGTVPLALGLGVWLNDLSLTDLLAAIRLPLAD